MGEWRQVQNTWNQLCPQGLLLGPCQWDLDDAEMIKDSELPGPLPDEAPFSVFEGIYDINMGAGYTIQPQLAQDAWIPSEWAQELGQPDRNVGMDYEPAEYEYEPEGSPRSREP